MRNLEKIADTIECELNQKDELRERALKECRDIIRESRKSIKNIHGGDTEQAREGIDRAKKNLASLKTKLAAHPDIFTAGYMENAMQELAEAAIFFALAADDDLPAPEDVGVSYTSYLMGLADVVGELRRSGVYLLKDGDIAAVENLLETMETISDRLAEFDYPSGLLPIKRKQDVVKKMLEKMRGELALFKKSKELESKIDAINRKLTKKEGSKDAVDINSLL
jgi:translin